MPSIAAIDARCFLRAREMPPPGDLDWAWTRTATPEPRIEDRPGEATASVLNSLIRRHFPLAAA